MIEALKWTMIRLLIKWNVLAVVPVRTRAAGNARRVSIRR